MKAFLENFAAILGTATVILLTLSVSHEYGYFWTIGRQFQTFLTATDYIANGVLWLPLGLFCMYSAIAWDVLPANDKSGEKASTRLLIVYIAVVAGTFVVLLATVSWPPSYFSAILLMLFFVFIWAAAWRKVYAKIRLDASVQTVAQDVLRLGVPVVVWMFLWGAINARDDLASTAYPYIFQFKGEKNDQLRMFLRNFDKGALLRNVANNRIEFHKWDDIVAVSQIETQQTETLICRLFNWECSRPPVMNP